MNRARLLTLSAALLLAHALAPSRTAEAQSKRRGLSTREFDTAAPAEPRTRTPAASSVPCVGGFGGTGVGGGGGVGSGSGRGGRGGMVVATSDDTPGVPQPCEPKSVPARYLSIFNFEHLVVSDSHGDTDRLYEDGLDFKRVRSVNYHSLCPEVYCVLVVMSTAETYTFKFKAAGPMRLELLRGVGNTRPDEAVRYVDLNLPRGAWALLAVTPEGAEDLRVDKDGDGSFESVVRPTAAAKGPAALDTKGPVVSFSATPGGAGRVRLTINAEDPSGVTLLLYSLDGRHFSPYTGPFEVDPSRVREVQAFAQDGLGNRSGSYKYRPAR